MFSALTSSCHLNIVSSSGRKDCSIYSAIMLASRCSRIQKYAEEYIQGVLSGHPENLRCLTRLTKEQLISLDEWLTTHGSLTSSKTTSTMFEGHYLPVHMWQRSILRDTRSHFRRSTSIISDAFHDVLDAMQLLYAAYVRLPDNPQPPHSRVADDPRCSLSRIV
jgi:hypothetical protein